MKKGIILIITLSLAGFFTSCDQNAGDLFDAVEADDILTIAEAEVDALKSAQSVDEEVDAAKHTSHMRGNFAPRWFVPHFKLGQNFPECAVVTVENESFPKTITIDYPEGCLTRRGFEKKGTITITVSDSLHLPGSIYTVEYENFSFGPKVQDFYGTYTNEGVNEAGNVVVSWTSLSTTYRLLGYHGAAANGTQQESGERTTERDSANNIGDTLIIVREASHTKEWIDGFDTPYRSDDKFLLSGGGTITVNDSIEFSRQITDPLFIDRACRFILSGVVEITKNGESLMLDYGDGSCDNIAVVTKDGESEEIELTGGKFKNKERRNQRDMKRPKGWW